MVQSSGARHLGLNGWQRGFQTTFKPFWGSAEKGVRCQVLGYCLEFTVWVNGSGLRYGLRFGI